MIEIEKLIKEKNQAYWERNNLLSYISKILPSWLEKHPDDDTAWEIDWRNIVFIYFPEGVFSWHFQDSEIDLFDHLNFREGNSWDGITTADKYKKMKKK